MVAVFGHYTSTLTRQVSIAALSHRSLKRFWDQVFVPSRGRIVDFPQRILGATIRGVLILCLCHWRVVKTVLASELN